uniref:Uncharacterized protein n=1 Tax=Mustela putorius furo TaxID=9669 RepID=M3Z3E7_MUSPF
MKTKDTYMKFSWLTVTGVSMDKEHKCIVNHENNRRKVDQEILFPSINKGLMAVTESEMDPQGHSETKRNTEVVTVSPLNSRSFSPDPISVDTLQLQLGNTSAYYTYLLLLLKSLVYSIIIVICLLGRPALSGSGKSS